MREKSKNNSPLFPLLLKGNIQFIISSNRLVLMSTNEFLVIPTELSLPRYQTERLVLLTPSCCWCLHHSPTSPSLPSKAARSTTAQLYCLTTARTHNPLLANVFSSPKFSRLWQWQRPQLFSLSELPLLFQLAPPPDQLPNVQMLKLMTWQLVAPLEYHFL